MRSRQYTQVLTDGTERVMTDRYEVSTEQLDRNTNTDDKSHRVRNGLRLRRDGQTGSRVRATPDRVRVSWDTTTTCPMSSTSRPISFTMAGPSCVSDTTGNQQHRLCRLGGSSGLLRRITHHRSGKTQIGFKNETRTSWKPDCGNRLKRTGDRVASNA